MSFELQLISNGNLALCNRLTGTQWPIRYKVATLYDKISTAGGRYVTESDWSGPAEELFSRLIPYLQVIRDTLTPIDESFKSSPTSSEHTHRNSTYYDEFQASIYTCRFRKDDGLDATVSFSFKNWDLIGVASEDMAASEKEALKKSIQLRLKSQDGSQDVYAQEIQPPISASADKSPVVEMTQLPKASPDMGWSWGAFFLTWFWMAGNRVWKKFWLLPAFLVLIITLFSGPYFQGFMLIPLFYLYVAVLLGRHGRRWAWGDGSRWESAERFNIVQRRWGIAGLLAAVLGIFLCLFPAWLSIERFTQADIVAKRNSDAKSTVVDLKTSLEYYFSDNNNRYPLSLDKLDYKIPPDILADCSLSVREYLCTAAHKEGTGQFFVNWSSAAISQQEYRPGDQVKAPRLSANK